MQIKDFQFIPYFLTHEVALQEEQLSNILSRLVEINLDGQNDTVLERHETIIYSNPSSVTRTLFTLLYKILSPLILNDFHKDKLALGLLQSCKNYVYYDYTPQNQGPAILIDFDKLHVPSLIIRELVEPLTGEMEDCLVLYLRCRFTDTCRIIDRIELLEEQYNLPRQSLSYHDFPLLMVNKNVYNSAAELAHITIRFLEMKLGVDKAHRVCREILLDQDSNIVSNMVLILRTMHGSPDFIIRFLRYFESNIQMTEPQRHQSSELQSRRIASDDFLRRELKIANDGLRTPQVFKQWSQWPMLMGLIEKQLSPMRGSMWPATESVKPHEDHLRLLIHEEAKKKAKTQLNFEEMLEVARDLYDHNAVEPGNLIEYMLRDERVWK